MNNITHAIRNPAGTMTLVGVVGVGPSTHTLHAPTPSDIMAGRYITDRSGHHWAYKQRRFTNFLVAEAAVEQDGGTMCNIEGCACRSLEN